MQRIVSTVLLGAVLLTVGCSSDSPTRPQPFNRLRLVDDLNASWAVTVGDPVVLARARALAGSTRQHWFYGTVRRGNGGHNAPWSWHLDPATVDFAEVTIEACQTTAAYVEEHLDEWMSYGTVCILSRVND